ncbi:unnamed protein product [Pleuronectes platessa]|uniref:Intraflagellar transport protein 122 homolog TPR domain-containing protein n=1 Tax=Pleuronectes platessa TaxID=8262 RepID=A0A9N7YY91_PLEPL|nr:unnamed protein product [Pleuronectes platessa]
MYLSAGENLKAIDIIGGHGCADMLIDLARKLNKAEREPLGKCALYFKKLKHHGYASEIYSKMGDLQALMHLHVETRHWEEAFSLVENQPQFKSDVFLSYSEWLTKNGRVEGPQEAFHKAGGPNEAVKVLEQLTHNACLDIARDDEEQRDEMLKKFQHFQHLAEVYHIYRSIQRYMDEPFSSHMPETLFNICRFLLNNLTKDKPRGISEDSIEMGSLKLRSKPCRDSEDFCKTMICYRSYNNPLLNKQGMSASTASSLSSTQLLHMRCCPSSSSTQRKTSVMKSLPDLLTWRFLTGKIWTMFRGSSFVPIKVSRSALRSMSRRDVLIKR